MFKSKATEASASRLAQVFERLAAHRYAALVLALVSFVEASFFPIPPYAMLIPMCVAQPRRALFFCTLGTLSSVAGGVFGYAIGFYAADWARELIAQWGYAQAFASTEAFFQQWGGLSILISAISPLPYKIMTITAGVFEMNLLVFVLTSILARGLRFFVAGMSAAKVTQVIQKKRSAGSAG